MSDVVVNKPKGRNIVRAPEANGQPKTLTSWLDPMHFETADLVEVEVTIGDEKFVLREIDEAGYVKYRNAQMAATRIETEGGKIKVTGFANMADTEPLLVSLCLFKQDPSDPDSLIEVPVKRVNDMKPSIVSALFKRAKLISNIDQEETVESLTQQMAEIERKLHDLQEGETDRAKNSLGATTDSSE